MRIGKFSIGLVVAALLFVAWSGAHVVVNWFIPNKRSWKFAIVWLAAMYLVGLGFRSLQRRWPAILADNVFVEDGPRLTLGRAVLGVGVLLLWAGGLIVLFMIYELGKWQTALIWIVMVGGLLWLLGLLEHRWQKQDGRS